MTTVFHRGELLIQAESGVKERMHKLGNKLIRDHIIDQHKVFFENLPYVFIALQDHDGRPWLSLMQGAPGFIQSPNPKTLTIHANVLGLNELGLQISLNKPIGIVGLDLSTRRRNRLNGNFKYTEDTDLLSIEVKHSFGNCPKYIQLRRFETSFDFLNSGNKQNSRAETFVEFNQLDIDLITQADTLFIASSEKQGGHLDANHRGGKPGFVRVSNQTQLWFNDYPGNNFFQTFGNIHNYPIVGLMFLDFNSGDLLLLSGKAELKKIDKASPKDRFLPRRVHFALDKGIRLKNAVRGNWSLKEISPFLGEDLD